MKTHIRSEEGKVLGFLLFVVLVVIGIWGFAVYKTAQTLHEFFAENKQLKKAISNLTQEDQIGYAKVIKQEKKDGKLFTTFKFVETARNDKNKIVLSKEYTIEGNMGHFDALIVKFDNTYVMDGTERALYLWRRVYGEHTPPDKGFDIEKEGTEPKRYEGLLGAPSILDKILLKKDDTKRFWDAIWELSNDQEKLKEYGITAMWGNVVYKPLKPGLIYVFKITNAGGIIYETVPDI
jgi:hypothetical protein